jgi:hypothetical protein
MSQKKKRALEQVDYHAMYVYNSDIWDDLYELISEFMGENEHAGNKASAGEVSGDVIENVPDWIDRRKMLLRADFLAYWSGEGS